MNALPDPHFHNYIVEQGAATRRLDDIAIITAAQEILTRQEMEDMEDQSVEDRAERERIQQFIVNGQKYMRENQS
jgi:hypothetical protein